MSSKRPTILVVDDDQPILLLMKNLLGEYKFDARTASSGEEAILAARATPPDLILLDLNMPGMAGAEVIEAIRREDGLENVPVLILSGDPVTRSELAELGAVGSVIKPFELQDLLAKIREQVDGKESQ